MKAEYLDSPEEGDGFSPLFPSSTAGDGTIRPNSLKTGIGQGQSSPKSMAHCSKCGFVFDRNKVVHSGGTMEGDGGLGVVTTTTADYTLLNGTTHSETYGDRSVDAGCPLCGSFDGTS